MRFHTNQTPIEFDVANYIVSKKNDAGEWETMGGPALTSEIAIFSLIIGNTFETSDFQIIEFNPVEGYSRDVTEDMSVLLRKRRRQFTFKNGIINYRVPIDREGKCYGGNDVPYRAANADHRLGKFELGLEA